MTTIKNSNNKINYSNRKKVNVDFSNRDLRRSNCYNCDFTGADFNNSSLRGAQLKSCTFNSATFEYTEFVASNLKKSKFKNVKFKNTLFDSVNLDGVDFEESEFENTIFIACDISKAINLNISDGIKLFEEMPKLEISKELKKAIKVAMKNEFIKSARVLDTKNGNINPISINTLLENFDKETLIKGLNLASKNINEEFCTLSYIINALELYKKEGIL